MTTFNVIMPCGTEKEKPSKSKAEEGAQLHVDLCDACGDPDAAVIEPVNVEADGGPTVVSDVPPEAHDQPEPQQTQQAPADAEAYNLPDEGPSVSEDPLTWMPDEFTDTVDGSVAINRKGFEVLAHHYDIQGTTEMVVSPHESDFEVVIHKATAVDADGVEYSAYGEAHAEDVDVDKMVRMSDTRAYKRAVSRATGVGMVAIEELQNEL